MISAATGAIALVIAPVAREYGLDYFVATVILAGIFQLVLGGLRVARLMRFTPRSVMVGFVNALAILIFLAQVPHLIDVPWIVYPLVGVGIAAMVGLPRLTQAVPAPLVAIVGLTLFTVLAAVSIPTVGDEGELPQSLPSLFMPQIPITLQTFQTIAPYAFAMAIVGLMESLMTAKPVDEVTDTHSPKAREAWGQGAANVITGFLGGMGGCAMIGQTMINVKASGARTRISTFVAGVFLLVLVVGLGDVVGMIPMAALVAVMIMVSAATFDWHSIQPGTLRGMPKSETTVMVSTVAVVVVTHNLAIGVVVGVLVAMILFARRVAHVTGVTGVTMDEDTHVYVVTGVLFFASSNDLVTQFDYNGAPRHRDHRPHRSPALGRLHRGRARRDHHESRGQGQERRDHRAQHRKHSHPRPAQRTPRRLSLTPELQVTGHAWQATPRALTPDDVRASSHTWAWIMIVRSLGP